MENDFIHIQTMRNLPKGEPNITQRGYVMPSANAEVFLKGVEPLVRTLGGHDAAMQRGKNAPLRVV